MVCLLLRAADIGTFKVDDEEDLSEQRSAAAATEVRSQREFPSDYDEDDGDDSPSNRFSKKVFGLGGWSSRNQNNKVVIKGLRLLNHQHERVPVLDNWAKKV